MRNQLLRNSSFLFAGHDAQGMNEANWGLCIRRSWDRRGPFSTTHSGTEVDESNRDVVFVHGEQEMFGPEVDFAQNALVPKTDRAAGRGQRSSVVFVPNFR